MHAGRLGARHRPRLGPGLRRRGVAPRAVLDGERPGPALVKSGLLTSSAPASARRAGTPTQRRQLRGPRGQPGRDRPGRPTSSPTGRSERSAGPPPWRRRGGPDAPTPWTWPWRRRRRPARGRRALGAASAPAAGQAADEADAQRRPRRPPRTAPDGTPPVLLLLRPSGLSRPWSPPPCSMSSGHRPPAAAARRCLPRWGTWSGIPPHGRLSGRVGASPARVRAARRWPPLPVPARPAILALATREC